MANRELKQHWRGVSLQDIAAEYSPISAAPEDVSASIEGGRERLEDAVLDGIIKRAKAGELDAVAWLEGRGLISLPGKPDERQGADSES